MVTTLKPDLLTELRLKWTGLRVLGRELGWVQALWIGGRAEGDADPFAALSPPIDEREILSRAQIGPAIKLYRRLCVAVGRERALAITEQVVLEASLVFLARTIGPLDIERYRRADAAERRAYLEEVAGRFFNAASRVEAITDAGFIHRVTHCHFVDLCAALDVGELAPLFCKGDLAFFSQGPVRLTRPATLSEGGESCEFRFDLRKS